MGGPTIRANALIHNQRKGGCKTTPRPPLFPTDGSPSSNGSGQAELQEAALKGALAERRRAAGEAALRAAEERLAAARTEAADLRGTAQPPVRRGGGRRAGGGGGSPRPSTPATRFPLDVFSPLRFQNVMLQKRSVWEVF